MAFTFAAFCYMLSLVLCAALIFFAIWHVSNLLRVLTLIYPKVSPCPPHFLISSAFWILQAWAGREARQKYLLGRPCPSPLSRGRRYSSWHPEARRYRTGALAE